MKMNTMKKIMIIALIVLIGCGFATVWFTFVDTGTEDIEGLKDNDEGFIFVVENTVEMPNSGVVVQGSIVKGSLSVNDVVKIVGVKEKALKSTITKLELKKKNFTTAKEGDELGIVLEGINNVNDVVKGQVVTSSSEVKSSKSFDVKLHVLTKSERGSGEAIKDKSEIKTYINLLYAKGKIEILDDGASEVMSGQDANAKIQLNTPMAVYKGEEIILFNDKTEKIAKCEIVNVY